MPPQHDGEFFLSTENLTSRRARGPEMDHKGALAAYEQWTGVDWPAAVCSEPG